MISSPGLYIFFGLIACGKSTLAKIWAKQHEMVYLNSDIVRKEMAGLSAQESGKSSFQGGIYAKEFTDKTYEALLLKAEEAFGHGCSVVLDASFSVAKHRMEVLAFCKKHGKKCYFIQCICPEAEVKNRLKKRAKDPNAVSDGNWEIYQQQKISFIEPHDITDLIKINTSASPEELISLLEKKLTEI